MALKRDPSLTAVVVDIAGIRAYFAPTRARGLHRMPLQHPVANVDGVNILFHDDVAGQDAVENPVAQSAFDGRSIGPVGAL
jgi:hypothetical protein